MHSETTLIGQRKDTASYVLTTKRTDVLEALLETILRDLISRHVPATLVLNEQTDSPQREDVLTRLQGRFNHQIACGELTLRLARPS